MAVAEVGLSVADFDSMTPGELEAILRRRAERNDNAERAAWERTRTLVVAALAPYTRAGTDPRRVLPLPWDAETQHTAAAEELTMDEIMARYRAAAAEQFNQPDLTPT